MAAIATLLDHLGFLPNARLTPRATRPRRLAVGTVVERPTTAESWFEIELEWAVEEVCTTPAVDVDGPTILAHAE